jgi:hypothetical protein
MPANPSFRVITDGQRAVRDWRLVMVGSRGAVMMVEVMKSGVEMGVAVLSKVERERSLRQKA